jgi:hypothetical protein
MKSETDDDPVLEDNIHLFVTSTQVFEPEDYTLGDLESGFGKVNPSDTPIANSPVSKLPTNDSPGKSYASAVKPPTTNKLPTPTSTNFTKSLQCIPDWRPTNFKWPHDYIYHMVNAPSGIPGTKFSVPRNANNAYFIDQIDSHRQSFYDEKYLDPAFVFFKYSEIRKGRNSVPEMNRLEFAAMAKKHDAYLFNHLEEERYRSARFPAFFSDDSDNPRRFNLRPELAPMTDKTLTMLSEGKYFHVITFYRKLYPAHLYVYEHEIKQAEKEIRSPFFLDNKLVANPPTAAEIKE